MDINISNVKFSNVEVTNILKVNNFSFGNFDNIIYTYDNYILNRSNST